VTGFLRRPRRKPRTLLIPNQWSGSVQEYYHFLLGYMGPVLVWIEHHPGRQIALRDCGPMQPWIDALVGDEDLVILNPGAMLHLFAGKVHRSVVLKGFDDPVAFDSRRLLEFRTLALRRLGISASSAHRVTVIDRASSGEFNSTAAAEVPASGAAVRSIPNFREAVVACGLDPSTTIVDSAHLTPHEQVSLFSSTNLLIGQHGAGLANMLWMPKGSTIIEILPPSPPWVAPIFANLAGALGHQHRLVLQSDPHSPIEPADLAGVLAQAKA